MKRKPRPLSGGQQQRMAWPCMVRNPAVFLLDEPLSIRGQASCASTVELKEVRTQVPTTSISATHEQVEAMTLGNGPSW